jgi:hypothetical protein
MGPFWTQSANDQHQRNKCYAHKTADMMENQYYKNKNNGLNGLTDCSNQSYPHWQDGSISFVHCDQSVWLA